MNGKIGMRAFSLLLAVLLVSVVVPVVSAQKYADMYPNNVINIIAPLMFFLAIAFVFAWPSVLITLIGNFGKEKQRLAVSFGVGIIAVTSGMIGTAYAGIPASPIISG